MVLTQERWILCLLTAVVVVLPRDLEDRKIGGSKIVDCTPNVSIAVPWTRAELSTVYIHTLYLIPTYSMYLLWLLLPVQLGKLLHIRRRPIPTYYALVPFRPFFSRKSS